MSAFHSNIGLPRTHDVLPTTYTGEGIPNLVYDSTNWVDNEEE
ncbi:hypothetical protein V6Z12_A13G070900 [Gossypium hirsutum]